MQKRSTALVIIDLQNGIVPMGGANADAVVANTEKALTAARRNGTTVVHIGVQVPEGTSFAATLGPGAPGVSFDRRVAPTRGEKVILGRPGLSAFAGTDLDAFLRQHGIELVTVAGFATEISVDSTMRDGAERRFSMELIRECCSGFSPETHNTFLQVLGSLGQFGAPVSVVSLEDFTKRS